MPRIGEITLRPGILMLSSLSPVDDTKLQAFILQPSPTPSTPPLIAPEALPYASMDLINWVLIKGTRTLAVTCLEA